jgi:hypothetical protein
MLVVGLEGVRVWLDPVANVSCPRWAEVGCGLGIPDSESYFSDPKTRELRHGTYLPMGQVFQDPSLVSGWGLRSMTQTYVVIAESIQEGRLKSKLKTTCVWLWSPFVLMRILMC